MLRTPITLTAAALAAALALSACGTVRLGAAAVTNTSRIPTATVTAEVNNLDTAYKADKAKVQLQFPASQMPQEVLSWLLRFRVREQMAQRNHLVITRSQAQQALASAAAQAKQSGVTLTQLAVANGVPPDQLPELGRYVAIQNQLLARLDGGTLPTGSAACRRWASSSTHPSAGRPRAWVSTSTRSSGSSTTARSRWSRCRTSSRRPRVRHRPGRVRPRRRPRS